MWLLLGARPPAAVTELQAQQPSTAFAAKAASAL